MQTQEKQIPPELGCRWNETAFTMKKLFDLGSRSRYYLTNGEIFTINDEFTFDQAKSAQARCSIIANLKK